MHRVRHLILPVLVMMLVGAACGMSSQPAAPAATPPVISTATQPVIATVTVAAPAVAPTPTLPGPYGPTGFPANINPLTGLAVADPNVLNRRPLLIKVSNQSPEVRPQSGLSFADHVWEYQMEGYALTRYTAVIYSQSPERVGSVRSARLIDVEQLVDMYGGMLVYSGGSSNRHAPGTPPRINELVLASPWAYRTFSGDWMGDPYFVRIPDTPRKGTTSPHDLFVIPAKIWQRAAEKNFNERPNLDGLYFNYAPPAGGVATTEAVIDYPGVGPKHTWRYDTASNRWLSFTEDQQKQAPEAQDGDSITGQPLAFDNVIILYAFHWDADYIEDEAAQARGVHANIDQDQNGFPFKIVLLRDGMRFEGTWQRNFGGGMIQFFDASGNPMALKPGNVWFQLVSSNIGVPSITLVP